MNNVFDILGPIMIGPSSSHTAGAARIGLMARTLLGTAPITADIYLHGSFAKTYRGHGTDRALVAGILGMRPDDERLRNALTIAKENNLVVTFTPTEMPDAHPNTAKIILTGDNGRTASLIGASIGGGNIQITSINDMAVTLNGEFFTFIVTHRDTPGAIAEVTDALTEYNANICNFHLSRKARGGEAVMSIEVDRIDDADITDLRQKIENLRNIYACIAVPPISEGGTL